MFRKKKHLQEHLQGVVIGSSAASSLGTFWSSDDIYRVKRSEHILWYHKNFIPSINTCEK